MLLHRHHLHCKSHNRNACLGFQVEVVTEGPWRVSQRSTGASLLLAARECSISYPTAKEG